LPDFSERADDAALFAGIAWPQRIVARPFTINRTGIIAIRIPDYGKWPLGTRPHVDID
jgi:hypothetical protein